MNLIKILFPHTCILCDAPTRRDIDLCLPCEKELPWQQITKHPTSLIAPFDYAAPIAQMITRLKFTHQLVYARVLGQLLAHAIKNNYQHQSLPELIIPVPLHPKRLRERGFNQALEISRVLKKILKIPLNKADVIRTKYTEAQSLLHRTERQKNLHHAFKVIKPLNAKHVAIIDDVITTGSTTRALSETLMHAGVEKIDVWCCAKTPLAS